MVVGYRSNVRRKIAQGRYRRLSRMYSGRVSGSNSGASTTPAGRTLSRITGSYRYANPMLIQPSNARTCSFWRGCSHSIAIAQANGFFTATNASQCLAYGFDLQGVRGWLGGTYTFSIPIANSTDFQSLFDTYKINAVKMKCFFSHNFSNVNTPATCLPIINIVNDFDDATESLTTSTVLEKAGVRIMQFDAQNHNGYNHYVKPASRQVVSQIDPTTGVESVSSAGVSYGAQWLDCANNNIIHSGVKLVYNNQGRVPSSVDIGTMTVYFEIEYVFKGYR